MRLIPWPARYSWPGRRAGAAMLVATGAVLAVAGCSGPESSPATASSLPPSQQPASPTHHGAHGVAGTITAENGTSWIVTTAKGKQVTVDITPQTTFRAEHNTATAQQFPVGTAVRVSGTRQGSTVTATKIVMRPARPPITPTSTPDQP